MTYFLGIETVIMHSLLSLWRMKLAPVAYSYNLSTCKAMDVLAMGSSLDARREGYSRSYKLLYTTGDQLLPHREWGW